MYANHQRGNDKLEMVFSLDGRALNWDWAFYVFQQTSSSKEYHMLIPFEIPCLEFCLIWHTFKKQELQNYFCLWYFQTSSEGHQIPGWDADHPWLQDWEHPGDFEAGPASGDHDSLPHLPHHQSGKLYHYLIAVKSEMVIMRDYSCKMVNIGDDTNKVVNSMPSMWGFWLLTIST